MEEPAKSGKSEKKRAAKTVIGTRERRTQGEPVVEGETVMGKAEAGTGCDGMAGAARGFLYGSLFPGQAGPSASLRPPKRA